MLAIIQFLFVLCLIPFLTPNVYAAELHGKVIRIADGDTLTLLIDCAKLDVPVRLAGIDAPEKMMPFGNAAKKALSDLAFGKLATIEWGKKDKYGRIVGKVMIDGSDVSLEMLKQGMAWHFKEYEKEQSELDRVMYAKAEVDASSSKAGLWQDKHPMAPWDWRKAQRAAGHAVVVEGAAQ